MASERLKDTAVLQRNVNMKKVEEIHLKILFRGLYALNRPHVLAEKQSSNRKSYPLKDV